MKLHIHTTFLFFTFFYLNTYSNQAQAAAVASAPTIESLVERLVPGATALESAQAYDFLDSATGKPEDIARLVDLLIAYAGAEATPFDKINALSVLGAEPVLTRERLVNQANDLLPEGLDSTNKILFLNSLGNLPYSRREKMVNVGKALFHAGVTIEERTALFEAMKDMPENEIPLRLANTLQMAEELGLGSYIDGSMLLDFMQAPLPSHHGDLSYGGAVVTGSSSYTEPDPAPRPRAIPRAGSEEGEGKGELRRAPSDVVLPKTTKGRGDL